MNTSGLTQVALSGILGAGIAPEAFVQYQTPPNDQTLPANVDLIPSWLYYGGDVKYYQDNFGNYIAGTPDKKSGLQ